MDGSFIFLAGQVDSKNRLTKKILEKIFDAGKSGMTAAAKKSKKIFN